MHLGNLKKLPKVPKVPKIAKNWKPEIFRNMEGQEEAEKKICPLFCAVVCVIGIHQS